MLRGLSQEPEMTAYKVVTLLASSFFLALVAMAVHESSVYFMSAASLSVLLVAYLASRISLRSLGCSRTVIDRVFDGDQVKIEVALVNRSRLPKFLITVEDTLSPWLETEVAPRFLVPALWPGQEVVVSYEARARRRGLLEVGPIQLSSGDPLGVLTQRRSFPEMSQALIYPRPVEIGSGRIPASEQYGAIVSRENVAAREGLEFFGVRNYQPGDELRHVHWKATARLGRLTVIEFEQDSSPELKLVLDLQRGTEIGQDIETTLEYGVKIAASLAAHAIAIGGGLTFEARDSHEHYQLEIGGSDQLLQLYEVLALVKADGPEPVSHLVSGAASRLKPGGSVTVITPSVTPMLVEAVGELLFRRARPELLWLQGASFDGSRGPNLARQEQMEGLAEHLESLAVPVTRIKRGDHLGEILEKTNGRARQLAF